MNKDRLLKLAALLDVVPENKFDMGTFAECKRPADKQPRCATRACALGWATAIPEFRAAGLRLQVEPLDPCSGVVRYRDAETSGDAGKRFFGITDAQCAFLFFGGSDTPKEKAKDIRRLVRGGRVPR